MRFGTDLLFRLSCVWRPYWRSDKLLKEQMSDVYPANDVAAITLPVPSHFNGTEAKGVFSEAGGWFWSKSLVER